MAITVKNSATNTARAIMTTIDKSSMTTEQKTALKGEVIKMTEIAKNNNIIDRMEMAALSAGDKLAGRLGATTIGAVMAGAAGYAAFDQAKDAKDALVSMVTEFKADNAREGLGDAVWGAVPDLLQGGGHAVLAAAFAYTAAKAGVNWAEHVGITQQDKL